MTSTGGREDSSDSHFIIAIGWACRKFKTAFIIWKDCQVHLLGDSSDLPGLDVSRYLIFWSDYFSVRRW